MTTKQKWSYPKTGVVKRGDWIDQNERCGWQAIHDSIGQDVKILAEVYGWRIRRPIKHKRVGRKTIIFRCPTCKKTNKGLRLEGDPTAAKVIEFQCPECVGSDWESITYFDDGGKIIL